MKHRVVLSNLLLLAVFLALAPTAVASSTWYVDGVNGSNNNDCKSPQTACKTIRHAISLASSGDSIMVAPATYTENLTISISLKVMGSGAATTLIDGGGHGSVVTISNNTNVTVTGDHPQWPC
jgi:nitrous oxidase accessory protein NosD